jgi:hypothetical protein
MSAGEQARAPAHQRFDSFHVNLALFIHRCHHQPGAGLLADQLPRDDVRVMFQMRDENFVVGLQDRPQVALRNQIDGLRGTAHEDDFVPAGGMQEREHSVARILVQAGRLLAQSMYPAVDVRMMTPLVVIDRADDGGGPLRRCAVVQIRQRLAANRARQHRKVLAYGHYVESRIIY